MALTLNQMTTIIAENMKRELDLPFRLILAERIKVWRSRLIANAIQKKPLQRKFFKQTLYLHLTETDKVPCTVLTNCKIAVTKELPGLVRAGSTLFDYVGGIDGKSPFREVAVGTGNYVDTGRFSSMFPAYEWTNQKLATDKHDLPMLRVDGIFDDPLAVIKINCDAGMSTDCDEWNVPFPVSGEIAQLIIQSIETIDYAKGNLQPTEDK